MSFAFISEDVTSRIGREKLAGFNEAVAERKSALPPVQKKNEQSPTPQAIRNSL